MGGPTNHEVLPEGMGSLTDAVLEIVIPLTERLGIALADIDCASFGMGGVDTPIQHEMISSLLAEAGFHRFVLSNDAYLGVKAECEGAGISAVNGTGYSVAGINGAGEMLQIGGHGEMTGDKGGGGYLVPAAVRSAYSALFKKGRKTRMTELIAEWTESREPANFCQAVATRILADSASAYNAISKILYHASAAGDSEARRILRECGEDYACSISCVAEQLCMKKPVDVILVGSQFTKCEDPYAISVLKQALDPDGTGEDFRLRVISTEPVAGALFWAMEFCGFKPDAQMRDMLNAHILAARGE